MPTDKSAKAGGVFSSAASEVSGPPKGKIDWITVAYFSVAALCFGAVIYFYLTG